jgi:hypothetical protein
MRGASPRARDLAGLPLAALLVHELRFQLACGHGSACAQGRGWLSILVPLAVAGIGMAAASSVVRRFGVASRRRAWVVGAVALLGLHVAQSELEHLLMAPEAGLLSSGGWVALPLALLASAALVVTWSAGLAVARSLRGAPLRPPRSRAAPARWGSSPPRALGRMAVAGFRVDRGPPRVAFDLHG